MPIALFAVIGPSMKLKGGPPRLRSRSWSKVRRSSHHVRISSSRAGWSGTGESGRNIEGSVYVSADMADMITESTFQNEVLESAEPVLVDFWAEWCGPCHAVAPILDQIAAERPDEFRLVKVNIDEEPELARRYGVMSIPTMILFERGQPKAAAIGAQPKRMLEKSLGLACD